MGEMIQIDWKAKAEQYAQMCARNLERMSADEFEIDTLRAALDGVVDAWEILPGGNYGVPAIQSWLFSHMKPAMDKARMAQSVCEAQTDDG